MVLSWLLPLLAAPASLAGRLWWLPAAGALPALAAAVSVPDGTSLEIPWLLLGSRIGLDQTGRIFLAFTAVLWLAAGLYAAQSMRGTPAAGRFRAFFLLAMAGNLWLIVGQDLVSFYLGFALMGLSSYGLVVHQGDRAALRAGKVYLVMTLLGEVALFAALVLIAAHAHSLTPSPESLTGLGDAAIGLLLLGLAVKAGLVPLHVWLPLAHPAAPVPASAVLSGAMIKVALLGWLRFLPVGQAALPEWGMLLVLAGLLTLFYAIPIGLVQSDPKVVLAYSSVSKMGFLSLILGLTLNDPDLAPVGVLALSLYAAHHGLVKGGLFLGVGLRRYAGAQTLLLIGLTLLALSLAGAPPSGGAVAKYAIKPTLIGTDWSWLTAAITLSTTATTLLMARFLWVIWHLERHPGGKHGWGAAGFGLLVELVLIFPLVLGSASAWTSNVLPVAAGFAVALPVAVAAWRRPAMLGVPIGLVRPGDLLGLVRPILTALRYLARELWRWWRRLLARAFHGASLSMAAIARPPPDPERVLRAWPNAGAAWLGITALLLALVLGGGVPGPAPGPEMAEQPAAGPIAASAPETPRLRPSPEVGSGAEAGDDEAAAPAQPPGPATPARVATDLPQPAPETPEGGATGMTAGPPQPTFEEAGPRESEPMGSEPEPQPELVGVPAAIVAESMPRELTAPIPESAPAQGQVPGEQAPCDPDVSFVLSHPGRSRPLTLTRCIDEAGGPRLLDAPPLSNALVLLVQLQLKDLGFDAGPADGLIGPRTRGAIRRFEEHLGLRPSGRIDFELLQRLQAPAGSDPKAMPPDR